jgi:hypothetical protein
MLEMMVVILLLLFLLHQAVGEEEVIIKLLIMGWVTLMLQELMVLVLVEEVMVNLDQIMAVMV